MEGVLKEIEGSSLDHDLVQQRLRLLAKSINWTNTGTDINWRNYNRVKKLLFNDEVSGGLGAVGREDGEGDRERIIYVYMTTCTCTHVH